MIDVPLATFKTPVINLSMMLRCPVITLLATVYSRLPRDIE
jgi:hypothetical protein